jgi:hypothetical protein
MTTTYCIAVEKTHSALEARITALLREGWECQGGIAVAISTDSAQGYTITHEAIFAQAMTRSIPKKRAPQLPEISQEDLHKAEEAGRKSLARQP